MAGHRRKRVVLSWVGNRDPHPDPRQPADGPVLALASALQEAGRRVDAVCLLHDRHEHDQAAFDTEAALRERGLCGEVKRLPCEVLDPTDHAVLYGHQLAACERARQWWPSADFIVGTASGTPQMQTAWLLLVLSGQLKAELLQAVPEPYRVNGSAWRDVGADFEKLRNRVSVLAAGAQPLATQVAALERERDQLRLRAGEGVMHATSETMRSVLQTAERFAALDLPVLITGPTGSGKSRLARYIHTHSARAEGPFQVGDMGAMPPTLIHTELFGAVSGAFTDGRERLGLARMADGGTLFLDEVAELPAECQSALLQLVEGVVRPMGSDVSQRVNARIIAATNRDLEAEIGARRFRSDLYYRLNILTLRVPGLDERPEDIVPLARHRLRAFAEQHGRDFTLSPAAETALTHAHWPGNLRQLFATLDRSCALCSSLVLQLSDLELTPQPADAPARVPTLPPAGLDLRGYLRQIEGSLVEQALARSTSVAQAAELLGEKPDTLRRRLARSGSGGSNS